MKYLLPNWVVLVCTSFLLAGCLDTGSSSGESGYSQAPDYNYDDPFFGGDNDDIRNPVENGSGESGSLKPPVPHMPKPTNPSVISAISLKFDPEKQIIPFPNNLIFEANASQASDLNGTLNAPIGDPNSSAAKISLALNDLNGFSTTESWRFEFTGPIDSSSLRIGQTIRVFELAAPNSNNYPDRIRPQSVSRELKASDIKIDYLTQNNTYVVKLRPLKTLTRNRTYTIVLTHGIKDNAGKFIDIPLAASLATNFSDLALDSTPCDNPSKAATTLLRCMTFFALNPVVSDQRFSLSTNHVMLAWAVTTQSSDDVFFRLASNIRSKYTNPSIPVAGTNTINDPKITCKTAICFLDVGSLLGKAPAESPGGKATIFPGTIRLPIYTSIPNEASNLGGNNYSFGKTSSIKGDLTQQHWSCPSGSCNSVTSKNKNEVPAIKGWVTHPVVLAVPKPKASGIPSKPSSGYPLVIFQHAIQQDRTNALALADTLAEHGFAVIAIDMPLHGLVKHRLDANDPRAALYAGDLNDQLYNSALKAARNIIPLKVERTFYLDLLNGDGGIDASGAHFLNPALPLTQRDILRQASLDLVTLARYLRNGEYSQCGMDGLLKSCTYKNYGLISNFDIDLKKYIDFKQLHFVGHSVGNIVAAPFLAFDQDIRTVSMLAPSGATLRALESSNTIGPILSAGLSEKGILAGTEDYYRFFASVQSAIDSVEPLNYASAIATRSAGDNRLEPRPIYMALLPGDSYNAADKVLPAKVAAHPLAGSLDLAAAMGLQTSTTLLPSNSGKISANNGTAVQVAALFRRGEHASFLQVKNDIVDSSINGTDPHKEMQRQVANFLKNQGKEINSIPADFLQ